MRGCESFKGNGLGEARKAAELGLQSRVCAMIEEAGPNLGSWARAGPPGGGVCAPGPAAAAGAALPASEGRRLRPGPSPEPPLAGASWSPRAGSSWGRAQARPAAEPRTEAACPRTRPAQPWWGSKACPNRSRLPPRLPQACPSPALVPPLRPAFPSPACFRPFGSRSSFPGAHRPPAGVTFPPFLFPSWWHPFFKSPPVTASFAFPFAAPLRPLTRPSFLLYRFAFISHLGSLLLTPFPPHFSFLLYAPASYPLSSFYLHCPLLSVSFLPFDLYHPYFVSPLSAILSHPGSHSRPHCLPRVSGI